MPKSIEEIEKLGCGTYIDFIVEGKSASGKTILVSVCTKEGEEIGKIKWFASWRQYSFFPFEDTVYEKTCLYELSNYLIELNQIHRNARLPA